MLLFLNNITLKRDLNKEGGYCNNYDRNFHKGILSSSARCAVDNVVELYLCPEEERRYFQSTIDIEGEVDGIAS